MKILLCAATSFEIQPTIDFITAQQKEFVTVLITGVGLTAATYQITKACTSFKPDCIIQAGVAGSLRPELSLGDVVLVKDEWIGDAGVFQTGSFRSLFDLKLIDDAHPWNNARLSNSNTLLNQFDLSVVNGVTVNEISTNWDRIELYRNAANAEVESLEGAALHYVGLMEAIPFLQVRSISNVVGERDKTKWKLAEAITNLNSQLQKIILKLLDQ